MFQSFAKKGIFKVMSSEGKILLPNKALKFAPATASGSP